ncbi:MFS transporter [Roseateles asaccharophilus]|uniref:MFS family arabinose efflux permease n=1 Tax=Roseateles asaccharophilus TaxID=582607 RepID=A0ABU2AF25_9BURK|nr:MFS transporter [Roseateles asaccharophilus]MDR7335812.1 putative MFS family arabinose efflux permease [Roseateles asaccharophilus]
MPASRQRVVATLGSAQTLAWASSYYLPAMLARPMAGELGVSQPTVFAAFSLALVVSALVGPHSGRRIDRWGGRPVLMATSVLFAAGLAAMALANGPVGLFAAWLLMGIAMGSGLYEAAFASLVRLYGHDARGAITGITLIAGFASTVGWPLTAALEHAWGWRGACWGWAALLLFLGLPLNALLPRADAAPLSVSAIAPEAAPDASPPVSTVALLAWVFAVTWFISTAMAAHLPGLLAIVGATPAAVIAFSALVGPAQVAGRLLEFGLLRHWHPLLSARLAALLHPLGAILLLALGAPAVAAFALLHGAGNGILTIAKGTLPLALFGPGGYGHRQGLLMLPARLGQALSPWLFGLLLAELGTQVLWCSAGLALSALAALLLIRLPSTTTTVP